MDQIKKKNLAVIDLLLLVIFFITSFFCYRVIKADNGEYNLGGWIWTETYGWISLSSENCVGVAACDLGVPPISYGVTIGSNGKISGWGWSENIGWVCFGDTCDQSSYGLTPDSAASFAQFDESTAKITGWAKAIILGGDGWIDLGRGDSAGAGTYYGEQCYDCQPACAQTESVGDPPQEVCVRYSDKEFDTCNTCFTRTRFDGEYIPDPGVESVTGGSGLVCSGCQNCEKTDSVSGDAYRIVCNSASGGSCNSCEQYGANRNGYDGRLLGWAWNGNNDGYRGLGWINFNSTYGGGYVIYPWLETKFGSIYSDKTIKQKAGTNTYNSTYCIYADNINLNVKSENCDSLVVPGVDIGFPTGSGIYRNALGRVDVDGLVTIVSGGRNKYGQTVQVLSGSTLSDSVMTLNNKVYYRNGDLTVDTLEFQNAVFGQRGNGTIVVNGNLYINGDVNYDGDAVSDTKLLASVAWIVKGDIIINPSVTKMSGALIILGQNGVACQYESGLVCDGSVDYPEYMANGHGIFFSGGGGSSLTVAGLVVARAFDFDRTYANLQIGSERIIYDGRLSANPPPGLDGFSEGLPLIRDLLID